MQSVSAYQTQFIDHLSSLTTIPQESPRNLYEPIAYILNLGGKRIRPILTLMAAEAFGSSAQVAMHAAVAVEVFHNFTLVHDDIMDGAPLRRGQPAVHQKWDINAGILSGDAMLIQSYQYLLPYPQKISKQLFTLFSQTALEVCEGQQYDMDFETESEVSLSLYLKMITYKTAVLLGCALQMGAVVAETSPQNQKAIYEFGKQLGIAFQLQDDYLDTFGDPEKFGKQVGGDIIENKKTFLYLKALELATPTLREELLFLYAHKVGPSEKIERTKSIFSETEADSALRKEILRYTERAMELLNSIPFDSSANTCFTELADQLLHRNV